VRRPSHSTVVAYIALFLALGAGGAMAASKIAKNSVGSKQLKKNSVSAAKIKKDAVTGAKVEDGSLTGSDLADGTITGIKVADGSLSQADIGGNLRASNVTGIAIGGNCQQIVPFPAGVSATKLPGHGCRVHFPSSVYECASTATVSIRTREVLLLSDRTVQLLRNPDRPNDIELFEFLEGSPLDLQVDLIVVC
jgi:hypothetical protein